MSFKENIQNNEYVKGFISILYHIVLFAIIASLIVNPASLNPEGNQLINIIIGFLLSELKNQSNYYFTKKNNKEGEQNGEIPQNLP